jgi:hypothetical protein
VFAKGRDYAGDILEMVISPSPLRRNICQNSAAPHRKRQAKNDIFLYALRLAWDWLLYHAPP